MSKPFPQKMARRFTRPQEVARIRHWFNSLPVTSRDYGQWCTLLVAFPQPGPVVIDFLGADGKKLVTATVETICHAQVIDFSAPGQNDPPLAGGNFLDRIEKLPR